MKTVREMKAGPKVKTQRTSGAMGAAQYSVPSFEDAKVSLMPYREVVELYTEMRKWDVDLYPDCWEQLWADLLARRKECYEVAERLLERWLKGSQFQQACIKRDHQHKHRGKRKLEVHAVLESASERGPQGATFACGARSHTKDGREKGMAYSPRALNVTCSRCLKFIARDAAFKGMPSIAKWKADAEVQTTAPKAAEKKPRVRRKGTVHQQYLERVAKHRELMQGATGLDRIPPSDWWENRQLRRQYGRMFNEPALMGGHRPEVVDWYHMMTDMQRRHDRGELDQRGEQAYDMLRLAFNEPHFHDTVVRKIRSEYDFVDDLTEDERSFLEMWESAVVHHELHINFGKGHRAVDDEVIRRVHDLRAKRERTERAVKRHTNGALRMYYKA